MKLNVSLLLLLSMFASVSGYAASLQFDLTSTVDDQVYLSGQRCSDISDTIVGSVDLEDSSVEQYSLKLNPSQALGLRSAGGSAYVQANVTVKAEVSAQVYDAESSIELTLFARGAAGWKVVDSFEVTATKGNDVSDAYEFAGTIPYGTTSLRISTRNNAFVDCGETTGTAQGSTGVVVSIDRASVWW